MRNNFPISLVSTLGVVSVEREDIKLFFGTEFTLGSFRKVSERGGQKCTFFLGRHFGLRVAFLALGAPASMHLEVQFCAQTFPKCIAPSPPTPDGKNFVVTS